MCDVVLFSCCTEVMSLIAYCPSKKPFLPRFYFLLKVFDMDFAIFFMAFLFNV
jgi:hypothetical protein